jgi:type I restriction enzyme, S subunit
MSEFPHGWSTRIIEEICDIHDYRRIPLSSEERRERKGPYPYYGANNIQDRIDDFIFDFDAVLIAEDGGYYDEHEYRDIAQYATGKYWVNNHAHILTGKPGLDTRFLYYALVRKNICPWINTGTRSKLNQSDLKQIELLVPPLPEQKKIAEILSGIYRYIQSEKIRLSKVVTIYNSLTSAIDQYGTATDSGEFVVSKSKVPAEWKLIPFGDLLRIEMEGFTLCENENYSPVVVRRRHSGIETRETKKGASILVKQQFKAKQGCFLISKRQVIHGSTGIIPAGLSVNPIISKEYTQLSSKDERVLDIDFLNFYSRTMLFHESIRISVYGVDIEKYVFKDLAWLKQMMLVPPLEEQKEIVCFCKSLEKIIAKYAFKIQIMQQLKTSLSADLLSGRKRVSI